jgi:predicted chitinase
LTEVGSNAYLNKKYDGRLGNIAGTSDGSLFSGSGYLHLTGRYNYDEFYKYMKSEYGKDDPLIMSDGRKQVSSEYAWESAGWFWTVLKLAQGQDLNTTSSASGTTITKTVKSDTNGVEPRARTGNSVVFNVSLAVNGGYNGIDDRLSYYEIVKGIIK